MALEESEGMYEIKIKINMTREEKQLLFKDLCARLPHGVKVQNVINGSIYDLKERLYCLPGALTTNFKPYLRPMSSMTEEEKDYYDSITYTGDETHFKGVWCNTVVDWLNAHHFDYREMIPMGLALPAPEGMYNGNF